MRYYIILIVTAVLLSSCGEFDKVLKGNDYEKKYQVALKLYHAKQYDKSGTLWANIGNIYRGTMREDTVQFYMAKCTYMHGEYAVSSSMFDEFRKANTKTPFLEEAEYLLAIGYYKMSPDVERDQSQTNKAIAALNEYMYRYPNSLKKKECQELVEELTRKLHEKDFLVAELYFKVGYFKSAIVAFRNAVKSAPESEFREEIMYYIVKSSYLFAKGSIPSKQAERYLSTIDTYYNFISEYPESKKFGKEVAKMYSDADAYIKKSKQPEDKNGNQKDNSKQHDNPKS